MRHRELAGRDVRELLPAQVVEGGNGQPPMTIARRFADFDSGEVEVTLGTAAGNNRLVALSFSTITANDERLMILLVRDLSGRKRLEDEKEEIQRQLYETAKLASLGGSRRERTTANQPRIACLPWSSGPYSSPP